MGPNLTKFDQVLKSTTSTSIKHLRVEELQYLILKQGGD